MIFSKELEKLAEERALNIKLKHGKETDSFINAKRSFIKGADAIENLIMKSVESEFDSDGALISCYHAGDCTDYVAGARWQHSRDQLIIGVLRKEVQEWKAHYDVKNGVVQYLLSENQQLEAKLKELENGKA